MMASMRFACFLFISVFIGVTSCYAVETTCAEDGDLFCSFQKKRS